MTDRLKDSCKTLPAEQTSLLRAKEHAAFPEVVTGLSSHYQRLAVYLGDTAFLELSRALRKALPDEDPDEQARQLPEFLRQTQPYVRYPELAEFATLELAIHSARNASCSSAYNLKQLETLGGEDIASMELCLQKPLTWLRFTTNVTSLWASLCCGVSPPKPEHLARPIDVIVWRQAGAARFRIMGDEETMILRKAAQGLSHGELSALLGRDHSPEVAADLALTYLRGWIEAELICSVSIRENASDVK
jgi:hypothetical protein